MKKKAPFSPVNTVLTSLSDSNLTSTPAGPSWLVALSTFPVIPKPLNIKLISWPLLQISFFRSMAKFIFVGSKLQPGGGSN